MTGKGPMPGGAVTPVSIGSKNAMTSCYWRCCHPFRHYEFFRVTRPA
ncbi:MAG: hypothetical protein MUE45_01555 [Methanoregulaceae archaeon]|nr:hypothetical protein [Methanoregulaceae archaeon]MCU0628164.1 hypothetical protein [Methanoregulaceae archaeon]